MKMAWIKGLIVVLISNLALAAPPTWQIIAGESQITFTATQNNAPVSGRFKKFSGEIQFDPEQLSESHARIVVETNSVSTSYKDLEDALKTAEWLNVKVFPQAIFETHQFTKTGKNAFEAKGNLTVGNVTAPVTVNFNLEKFSETKGLIKGSSLLKRTQFGLGKGEWASTDEVKDEVKINFILNVIRK